MLWDEENRLRGLNDNGKLHLYSYDHTGERALKSSAESSMAVINGASVASITHTDDYTAYISPYFVVNKGKFTKHFFEGSSRIVSWEGSKKSKQFRNYIEKNAKTNGTTYEEELKSYNNRVNEVIWNEKNSNN